LPVATIAKGLQIALASGVGPSGKYRPIMVATGFYPESGLSVQMPVDLIGSLNSTTWLPTPAVSTVIYAPASGVTFNAIAGPSLVRKIEFRSGVGADGTGGLTPSDAESS